MKRPYESVLTATAILITVCTVAISGYLWFANVGQKWTYAAAVGIMAVAWLARRFSSADRNVTSSLVAAGALLSVALGAKALEHLGWVAISDIAERTNGVIVGAVLVMLSNAIPKRMSSADTIAMLRTVGRAFVIGGFGYACAWLVLPLRFADTVALAIVLASGIVAAVSYIWWQRARARRAS